MTSPLYGDESDAWQTFRNSISIFGSKSRRLPRSYSHPANKFDRRPYGDKGPCGQSSQDSGPADLNPAFGKSQDWKSIFGNQSLVEVVKDDFPAPRTDIANKFDRRHTETNLVHAAKGQPKQLGPAEMNPTFDNHTIGNQSLVEVVKTTSLLLGPTLQTNSIGAHTETNLVHAAKGQPKQLGPAEMNPTFGNIRLKINLW